MADKLVSVDSGLHLPNAVQTQLKADLASDFASEVAAAELASGNATTSAGQAAVSEANAAASAALAAAPTDVMVAGLIPGPSSTKTALDGAYVSQDQVMLDLRLQPGVVGDGVTDDATAIQSAFNSAASLGMRVFARGTFLIASTVTIKGATDLADATFLFTGTGIAIQVGDPTSLIFRSIIVLPKVIASAKTTTGWTQVAGTTGIRVTNLYSCFLTITQIKNFETGLHMHGQTPNGSSYNTLYLGQMDNNKVNILISPQDSGSGATSGWVNQNTYIGGRCSHNSNEGTQTAGTRHILIVSASNAINNNTFYGTSLESPSVVEYHIEVAGWYNYFDRCRWENTTPAYRRVLWTTPAKGNVINGGIYAADIIASSTSPYTSNLILSDETGINGSWIAYVPTWTSSGTAPVLGNGTLTGRYLQVGHTVLGYEIRLTAGSTTTFGTGNYTFSLPVAHQNANVDALGWVYASIAGTKYAGVATKTGSTGVQVLLGSTTLTGTAPGTMASGNTVSISGAYEGA